MASVLTARPASPSAAPARWPRAPLLGLVACGALLTLVYAVATWRINLPRYFPEPGITVDFVYMLGPDWGRITIAYMAVSSAALALYLVAVVLAWRTAGSLPRVVLLGFPVLFALALLLMYPPQAVDMFHYHADARTLWVHGENPLTVAPDAHGYPIGMSWQDQPSPYGPVWSLLTAVTTLPTQDHYLAGLIALKLLAAASYFGCAWLIYRMVRRMRPGFEVLAFVLFAWNPYVLERVVGNGHNDLVMMFFALRALDLAERGSWVLAFQALALSVLTKYVSALLGPPLLLYALWQLEGPPSARLRALAPALGLAALTTVVLYIPFWDGMDTFETVRGEAGRMITSTPLFLRAVLFDYGHLTFDRSEVVARRITLGIFALCYLVLVWEARRNYDRLIAASFTVLFLYTLIGAAWFRPWYMLWPVTLAALRPRSWLAFCLVGISAAAMFADLAELAMLKSAQDGHITKYSAIIGLQVATWGLLPLLIWLAGLARFRTWHFDAARASAPVQSSTG